MAMINLPIGNDGFQIGIGDSNRDGKIDFDFGLRSESWGGGPFGFGHSGAEIGFNTQRGVYAGGDYSNHNAFGSQGGGGRVFADGGFEGGSWSNDVFGNHNQNYANVGPGYAQSSSHGGNVYNGNYYGHQSFANPWEAGNTSYAGNSWNGANMTSSNYGNVFGQGGSFNSFTPPFVPSFGGGHYHGCGCGCASQFMCF
jgi:hypothetical protein